MLRVNINTIKEAEAKSGLNSSDFAKRLGIGLSTYSFKLSESGKCRFTLDDVLIAQDLSGIPIQNFFESNANQLG